MVRQNLLWTVLLIASIATSTASAANVFRLEEGKAGIQQAGVLAFGPQGILFVGDTKAAAVFAIGTGDTEGDPESVKLNIPSVNDLLADQLQVESEEVTVNDLAVNPLSGNVYLSVSYGGSQQPAIVRIDAAGQATSLNLDRVWFSKAVLPDAPADSEVGRRRRNPRNDAITDIAFVEGQVIVSGMTNRDAPSGVRTLPFPFQEDVSSSSLEIYHGAHGRSEDDAVIRTFVPFMIDGRPNLLAGFVCTPLVRFPLDEVRSQPTIEGTTVAELGNRNRPLDMFVYEKDGNRYLLLSNTARGVMKIGTDQVATDQGITQRVERGGTAGQSFETVSESDSSWENVVQMDRLNASHAIVLRQQDGTLQLVTKPLP